MNTDDILRETLARHGLLATSARMELLRLFKNHGEEPLSANRLQKLIQKKTIRFDRATVFRNLKAFADAGLAASSNFGTGSQFYWIRPDSKNHHHYVFCQKCEKAEPLGHCGIGPMIEKAEKTGYTVSDHRVEVLGICPRCK